MVKEVEEETKLDDDVVLAVAFDRNAVSAQLPPHVEKLSPEQTMLQVVSSIGVPSPFSKEAPPKMSSIISTEEQSIFAG